MPRLDSLAQQEEQLVKILILGVAFVTIALTAFDAAATHSGTCGYDSSNRFSCDGTGLSALAQSRAIRSYTVGVQP